MVAHSIGSFEVFFWWCYFNVSRKKCKKSTSAGKKNLWNSHTAHFHRAVWVWIIRFWLEIFFSSLCKLCNLFAWTCVLAAKRCVHMCCWQSVWSSGCSGVNFEPVKRVLSMCVGDTLINACMSLDINGLLSEIWKKFNYELIQLQLRSSFFAYPILK